MDRELLKNGSGYTDYVAYKAIMNCSGKENTMEFKRGEIFEYEQINNPEIKKALVVSADFRATDKYISIIMLNDKPLGDVNVPIICGGQMYADCGRVSFAHCERLSNYIRTARAEEMEQIDAGIMKCLGLDAVEVPVESLLEAAPVMAASEASVEFYNEELARAKTEAEIYKGMYDRLLEKILS